MRAQIRGETRLIECVRRSNASQARHQGPVPGNPMAGNRHETDVTWLASNSTCASYVMLEEPVPSDAPNKTHVTSFALDARTLLTYLQVRGCDLLVAAGSTPLPPPVWTSTLLAVPTLDSQRAQSRKIALIHACLGAVRAVN